VSSWSIACQVGQLRVKLVKLHVNYAKRENQSLLESYPANIFPIKENTELDIPLIAVAPAALVAAPIAFAAASATLAAPIVLAAASVAPIVASVTLTAPVALVATLASTRIAIPRLLS